MRLSFGLPGTPAGSGGAGGASGEGSSLGSRTEVPVVNQRDGAGGGARGAGSSAISSPIEEERWEEVREQNLRAQVRPQLELVERWVLEQKEPEASQEMERKEGQEEQVLPQFLHRLREERWEEVREQNLRAQVRPQLELVEQ